MTKYLPLIVTSEIDKNYFIINNGIFYNSYLTELLKKQDIELAKIILSIKENPELLNQKIFVEKSTKLGIELEKLINKKQIISENQIIRESYLLNALVSAVLNKEEQEYINTIANLINKNYFNAIFYYDSPLLKKINFDGRKNNYFKSFLF